MKRILVAVAALACGLSGCASARQIEKTADGGIVAIPSNADFWPMNYRAEAMALIEKHVGPNYEIVEEKEVVVGVTTNHNQQVKREPTYNSEVPFFEAEKQTVTNTTTSTDRTEYRIAYRRRAAPVQTQYPSGIQNPRTEQPAAAGVHPAGAVVPAVGPKAADPKQ
jgi:uncharacterized protein YgiM (DUF1202 family)